MKALVAMSVWLLVVCLGCGADDPDPAAVVDSGPADAELEADVEPAPDTPVADTFVEPRPEDPKKRLAAWCPGDSEAVEADVDTLLAAMTLEEKVDQMSGVAPFPTGGLYLTPALDRLGIPGIKMVDGPRGVSKSTGNATAFPVGMARAATWSPSLEQAVGAAMAREAAARGADVLLAPTINILRHPRWGRAQETYGEDPVVLAKLGTAFVKGVQGEGVMASAKHFAVNSIEDTRFEVNVTIDQRTLRELYLPHFEAIVREGHVASVMSAYNKVNGTYCGENGPLLRDILKDEWGFVGFVESDWIFGTKSTAPAANAGLDIEMPVDSFFGTKLIAAVEAGEVAPEVIDGAVRRILRAQLCYGLDKAPKTPNEAAVETAAHLQLAREVATRAAVLLKNDSATLPLDAQSIGSVVLVGPLADAENVGDVGSSDVVSTDVITPLEGLALALGAEHVTAVTEFPFSPDDETLLKEADAVICVVGLTAEQEGEGLIAAGDREDMALPQGQPALISAAAALNERVIVVLEGGSAITMDGWLNEVEAVLLAWYPGAQGGHALADLIVGAEPPAGRLPIAFPKAEADLPAFDNVSLEVTYDYWHGYRHLDRQGTAALFEFGYGLTYTSFAYDAIRLKDATILADGSVQVEVDVTNTGDRAAEALVVVFTSGGAAVERAPKDLRAFGRAMIEPGKSATVTVAFPAHPVAAYWNVAADQWTVESGTFTVLAGPHAGDLPLSAELTIP